MDHPLNVDTMVSKLVFTSLTVFPRFKPSPQAQDRILRLTYIGSPGRKCHRHRNQNSRICDNQNAREVRVFVGVSTKPLCIGKELSCG